MQRPKSKVQGPKSLIAALRPESVHAPDITLWALGLLVVGLLIFAAFQALSADSRQSVTLGSGLKTQDSALSVFAASSLKEAFTECGKNFQAANPNLTDLHFNFQGSQALVAQLQQGAPADVFASADKASMDRAAQAGLIEGAPRELARNLLTVVLPGDNGRDQSRPYGNIRTLKDLARPGVKLSLADPAVPVGAYTLQMLDKLSADPVYGAGFKRQALGNVVSYEDNVRQVLTRVQLGEVDAGVVYATDALAANAGSGGSVQPVNTLVIPDKYNVVAVYYVGAVKGAAHPGAARAWINYVLSGAGQGVLAKYGFSPAANP